MCAGATVARSRGPTLIAGSMLSARVQAGLGRLQRAGWAACACALAGPTARGISDSAGGEGGAADSGVEGSRASGDDGGKFPEQIVIKPTPVVGLHRLGALDEAGAASEESLPFLDDFGGLNKPLVGACTIPLDVKIPWNSEGYIAPLSDLFDQGSNMANRRRRR